MEPYVWIRLLSPEIKSKDKREPCKKPQGTPSLQDQGQNNKRVEVDSDVCISLCDPEEKLPGPASILYNN